MQYLECEMLVLGGGPGGYACAARAARLGLDTVLVERNALGGTCLHAGCIPSKALIHAAALWHTCQVGGSAVQQGIVVREAQLDWTATQLWKDGVVEQLAQGVQGMLQHAGVRVLQGTAEMLDGKRVRVRPGTGAEMEVAAEHVVLALGSREIELPGLPAGPNVLYAEQALALTAVPERLVVVGGGYIGLELGQAYARLGAAVTVVEATAQLLPQYDAQIVAVVTRQLELDGVEVLLQTRAEGLTAAGDLQVLALADGTAAADKVAVIAADKILVAVGRRPQLEGWGFDNLALDAVDGCLQVDRQCQTSMEGLYAIGDLTGEPMLAHRALAQAAVVAEHLAGRRRSFEPRVIPAVCFTSPEVVSVGLDPEAAAPEGELLVARMPLRANGRAKTLGADDGFVRVVARADDHTLLGVQAVGHELAELVHSATLALEMGARLEDIVDTIHAHPTLGESFAEAAQAALGLPLHGVH